MREEEYNEIIFSLRESTFHMNDAEALEVVKMFLANEYGLREYITKNNLNGQSSVENYLLKLV